MTTKSNIKAARHEAEKLEDHFGVDIYPTDVDKGEFCLKVDGLYSHEIIQLLSTPDAAEIIQKANARVAIRD